MAGPPRRCPSRPPGRHRAAFEPLPGSVYHAPYPYRYRAAGGPTTRRPARATGRRSSTCCSPSSSIRDRSPRSSSSRSSARAATSCRRRGSCRASASWPGSTASCSSPTRSRPASGGPAGSAVDHWDVAPDILVMAKGIASGLPLSGILARTEILDALEPGRPRRHLRRQRRRVRGGPRHARRHRGRGPRGQRPRARRTAARRSARAAGGPPGHRRRPRAGLHGRAGVRRPGRRRPASPTPPWPSGSSPRRSIDG